MTVTYDDATRTVSIDGYPFARRDKFDCWVPVRQTAPWTYLEDMLETLFDYYRTATPKQFVAEVQLAVRPFAAQAA